MTRQEFERRGGDPRVAEKLFCDGADLKRHEVAQRLRGVVGRQDAMLMLRRVGGKAIIWPMVCHVMERLLPQARCSVLFERLQHLLGDKEVLKGNMMSLLDDLAARPPMLRLEAAQEAAEWAAYSLASEAAARPGARTSLAEIAKLGQADAMRWWVEEFAAAGLRSALCGQMDAWSAACCSAEWAGGGDVADLAIEAEWEWWIS